VTLFEALKATHVLCAVLSISGFTLRGYWMMTGNPLLNRRLAKTLPHIVDTLLLGSAIGMLFSWHISPFSLDWLTAKIIALLLYIGLGMMALRFGKSRRQRIIYWFAAMAIAVYIVSVALSKSVWPGL